MGKIGPSSTKVIGITAKCGLIEVVFAINLQGDPSGLKHKFLIESVDAQKDDVLSSVIFSGNKQTKKQTLPVVYRKRYTGQPSFDSRSSIKQRAERTSSKKSDLFTTDDRTGDRTKKSRVIDSTLETPIIEKKGPKEENAQTKLVTTTMTIQNKIQDDYNNLLLELRSLNLKEKNEKEKGYTMKFTIIAAFIAFLIGYLLG